ncbi:hypothetical protein [Levilactobacillus parabrevis]|uniref:hypothetical protein n=1 Tax=Levilactobacillus parabrevis TaxID=357278 RepID=UPI0021A3CA28|nr:hypothetical protein [Levilactobacillus parabrevis]MCT4487892.1 hypothetical protein [Levilactobacillus parabrevis]MCT4491242.1 hypothetical protein [Levilactobacillus parabrevis]
MNDMEKAQAVIAGDHKGLKISKVTGVTRVTISNYRTGKSDVAKGSWVVVTKLARFYDAYGANEYDKQIKL